MALQMWLLDDIRNVLLGLELTSAASAAQLPDEEARAYRLGFRTALAATALSLGVTLPELAGEQLAPAQGNSLLPRSSMHDGVAGERSVRSNWPAR